MQNANLNNFNPSTRVAIKEFEAWQRKKFAKNIKKGWRYFQPEAFEKPVPRSAREAWGSSYERENIVIQDNVINFIATVGLILLIVVLLSIF